MGFASRGITSADILTAITDDDTRFSGANIDVAISSRAVSKPTINYVWNVFDQSFLGMVGTWATTDGATYWLGRYLHNNTGTAINDQVAIGAFCIDVAGTYTLYMLSGDNTNHGICHFLINTVDSGQLDFYDAGGHPAVLKSVSLGALTVGVKTLSVKMASKNGSSSDYRASFQLIAIMKT